MRRHSILSLKYTRYFLNINFLVVILLLQRVRSKEIINDQAAVQFASCGGHSVPAVDISAAAEGHTLEQELLQIKLMNGICLSKTVLGHVGCKNKCLYSSEFTFQHNSAHLTLFSPP